MTVLSSKPNQPSPTFIFRAVCFHLTRRVGRNGIQVPKATVELEGSCRVGILHQAEGQLGHGEWVP